MNINNRLNQIMASWHTLTQTNDAITNADRDNVDPLILHDAKDIEYKSAFCSYLRKGTEHSLSNLEIKSSLVGDNNKYLRFASKNFCHETANSKG
ncbi:MAG: hypothetical protein MRQ13_05330 [Candidatus Midichloria sp.]|nr:hypothetical protein [Candidatus Midichloria sp.]